MRQDERELPMLAGIGGMIHWLEELTALLAGPLLTAGLAIAIIDLLTDGKLLATTPALLYAWAFSLSVGLDAQLVGSAAKLGRALRRRAAWPIIGYSLLVVALGYVAFQASNVFATQQAEGITTAQALARLGMDSASWIVERSALAVVLVVLSGLLRYTAPAKAAVPLADERAQLQRALELEPLRQRLRAQQVGGFRTLAETALRGAGGPQLAPGGADDVTAFEATGGRLTATPTGQQAVAASGADRWDVPAASPDAPPDDLPPAGGPGSPAEASKPRGGDGGNGGNVTTFRRGLGRPPRSDRRTASRANARAGRRGTAEARIRAALASDPALSHAEIVKRAKVSASSASKWLAVIEAERAAERRQAAQ